MNPLDHVVIELSQLQELQDLKNEILTCQGLQYDITHGVEGVSFIGYVAAEDGRLESIDIDLVEDYYLSDSSYLYPVPQSHNSLKNWKYKDLVIILESPHVNDYKGLKEPETLKIIKECRQLLFHRLFECGIIQNNIHYRVRIIDSVSRQASLGRPQSISANKDITYRIWKALWYKLGYREKFINIIRGMRSDSIILNACTGGTLYQQGFVPFRAKDAITQAINEANIPFNLYYDQLSHPASMKHKNSKYNYIDSIEDLDPWIR